MGARDVRQFKSLNTSPANLAVSARVVLDYLRAAGCVSVYDGYGLIRRGSLLELACTAFNYGCGFFLISRRIVYQKERGESSVG